MEVYINVKNKLKSDELTNYLELIKKYKITVCIPNQEARNYFGDYYIQNYELGNKINNAGYLLNHSDYNESTRLVKDKLNYINSSDKKILLCVGEKVNNSKTRMYLKSQISELINEGMDYKNVTFVYEPHWAIGKKDINYEVIEKNIVIFKELLEEKLKIKSKIIYGGGLTLKIIEELYKSNLVDGILICSLALDLKNIEILSNKYDFI